jgi:predicted TIM-barrel fold metal-dependent hydrolase
MRTVWGEVTVSDAHVHFFSHNFFTLLASQKPNLTVPGAIETLGWRTPPEGPVELAAEWTREMDRHGISRAALIASLPGDESSVQRAVAAYPQRFCGYFMVNPCASDSLERTESALAAGNLHGVCLFPAMHRYEMNDPRAQAIVGAAAAHPGTVVFVHCGVLSVGVRKRLGLPSLFDMRYSNPIHLHSTALSFPQVRFIVPHFGAGYFREALMLCDLCPNVYLDTSSSNRWITYEGLDLETVFRRALEIAGPKRLVFGTDSSFFPRGWQSGIFEQQAAVLLAIGIDSEAAQSIFSGNFDLLFNRIQQ